MSDWAHIYLAYGVAAAAPALYALSLVRRGRLLADEAAEEETSWTR